MFLAELAVALRVQRRNLILVVPLEKVTPVLLQAAWKRQSALRTHGEVVVWKKLQLVRPAQKPLLLVVGMAMIQNTCLAGRKLLQAVARKKAVAQRKAVQVNEQKRVALHVALRKVALHDNLKEVRTTDLHALAMSVAAVRFGRVPPVAPIIAAAVFAPEATAAVEVRVAVAEVLLEVEAEAAVAAVAVADETNPPKRVLLF